MQFLTIDDWDEHLWKKANIVYQQAFGKTGAKPEKIIRNMFAKKLCFLHLVSKEDEVIGMAMTGIIKNVNALLIDYMAVREDLRGRGVGQCFLNYIKSWCKSKHNLQAIILEVESDGTHENKQRILFWQKNDFLLTTYIHHYIWVPEPYQAMYLKFVANGKLPTNGEELFQYIVQFHKESFHILKK